MSEHSLIEVDRIAACAAEAEALLRERDPVAAEALLRGLAAAHPLTLGCPLCPRLVGEEPSLLLAVALAQRGPRTEALACLLRRLPPPRAYQAMASAIGLGIELRRAGLVMADPWQRCG